MNAEFDARLKVLVVDDNVDAASSLAELMHLWGFDPMTAENGADALNAIEQGLPDVVFLELRLPDMDGCELVRRVRERSGDESPLFIALTTFGRQQSLKAGVALHLLKPADPVELLALLVRYRRLVADVAEQGGHSQDVGGADSTFFLEENS